MSNARNIGKTTGTNTGDQTSLPGGVTGSVLYQSGVGVTAMTAAGTTGQVLTTLTTGANPTWQTPSGAAAAGTLTGATLASNVLASSLTSVGTLAGLTVTTDASINGLTVGKGTGTGAGNSAVGMNALNQNTTGVYNSAFGSYALYSNDTGNENTAVGMNALYSNTIGNYNSAFGVGTSSSNTTGEFNSAFGNGALNRSTTGSNNLAVGSEALYWNTEGNNNSAVGRGALQSNTTANNNSALGSSALNQNTTGNNNSAVGAMALFSNTTGIHNSAMGVEALYSNTTANYNSAIGSWALRQNTIGHDNISIGVSSLFHNTEGNNNSAVGTHALQENTTGNYNSAVGQGTLLANITGDENSGFGYNALGSSLSGHNTAIGSNSGYQITTGSYNVVIGSYTGFASPISETGSNFVVLSDGAGTVRQTYNASGALAFGTAGTSFGTAGQVLQSNGNAAVPTWETPSGGGGVGGTTGQVQYNNAGAMAGASYVKISGGHLNVADAGTIPTTPPAGTLTYFAEDHAGRMLPSVIGPSGVDFNLQSALYGNTNYMWLAGTAAIAAISWGTAFTPVQAGTAAAQSHPAAKLSTSAMTSMNRANYSTGSTTTGSAGVVSASTVAWLGNAAGLGGFLFFARFGVETASVNTYRVFVGLSGTGAVLAGEPSALINSIALVKDAADTTWFISTRGATSAKTNTGITVTVGQVLDVYIHTAPFTSSVKVEIKNAVTGATLYVTPTAITATLPVNTMFMFMQSHIMSSAGTTAKVLGLNRMYLETDL